MLEVFKFECRYQLRSPLFLILALVFFAIAFLIMASEDVSLGGVGNNTNLNAAWTIVYTQFFFSLIGMLAAIALVAQAITRDYEIKSAEILFATGVNERSFLLGRFSAGCLAGMLVGVAGVAGTMAATLMPWLDQERVGEFAVAPYFYALGVIILPNLFFSSAFFFTVAALTRSMLAAFVAAVAFLVLNIVVGTFSDPEQVEVFAMLDPFGGVAFSEVSRYWTVFERNTELVPIAGNLLANRILWFSIGLLALIVTTWRYQFTLNPSPFRRSKKPNPKADPVPNTPLAAAHIAPAGQGYLQQFRSQVRMDLIGVFKSIPFYALLGLALLNVWASAQISTGSFGISVFPTTSNMLQVINGAYGFFILMIVIYYSAELVHRERQTGVSLMVDAMPFPNGVMVASKIITLWLVILALYLAGVFVCIGVQLIGGYSHLEIGLYLRGIFGVQALYPLMLAVLAVFVQSIANNKWLGMITLLAIAIGFATLSSVGLEHDLYNFGPPIGNMPHSDMNGFGHYVMPFLVLSTYWACFCVLLASAAHLIFPRGNVGGIAERLKTFQARLSAPVITTCAISLIAFAGFGGWIYYNTDIVNTYRTSDLTEIAQAKYEQTYKKYELMDQLEPIAVDTAVDLYPAQRRLESRGTVIVRNVSSQPISELFLSTHQRLRVNELTVQGGTRFEHDPDLGVHLYKFDTPILPNADVRLTFDTTWDHQGFENSNANDTFGSFNRVVANGTFVDNTEIMPTIGYNRALELSDPNKRREYELPAIVRLPKMGDPDWLYRSQFGFSQRTAFRTTITTSADQTAIAPGYLVGEVETIGERRKFTYEMDDPIWPFFSFSSARYAVAKDKWNDVDIEVYYHPEHDYNIEPMIRGTKRSLDYFNEAFTPYQYRQFRILEFPRYASFAQSFPNTIPFSEAIGFVADLTDENSIDQVFYVTAHELAHQWWGHQVAGAQMQGMTVIVETLAQYSALMVMEAEYGKDKMRRFLRYELDRYLQQRGSEQIEELPLVLSENQPYIHYRKGSLVMYALQDLIGADAVNLALRNFLEKFAYGSGPFPTARNLVTEFRAVAAQEHQSLISDLFENITLYDLAVEDASMTKTEAGWEVRFSTRATKFYADGEGRETDAPIDTWVDVAVFPEDPEDLQEDQLPTPLFIEKRRITGADEVVITLDQKPHRVGIDPYNKLIDRNPEDNLKTI